MGLYRLSSNLTSFVLGGLGSFLFCIALPCVSVYVGLMSSFVSSQLFKRRVDCIGMPADPLTSSPLFCALLFALLIFPSPSFDVCFFYAGFTAAALLRTAACGVLFACLPLTLKFPACSQLTACPGP